MRTVAIKILKNRLSEFVRLATQGEVVARVVAPQTGDSARVSDALLAELVRTGVLMPALAEDAVPPVRWRR